MKNPLLDKDFLLKLDKDRNRKIFVRLLSLDLEENTVEEINGRVQSGSISVDGSSSVRRTCSLSIVANELDIHQYYWGLKTKFKCFIGVENNIDDEYPDVIYFPMGTFIITSFNTTQNLNNYSISISGKDKMAFLNGELGGTITAISVDFGQLSEQQVDGSIVKKKLLLKDIIKSIVQEYAHEQEQNIVINDLDEPALELMEYIGDETLYLIRSNLTDEFVNQSFNPNQQYWVIKTNRTITQIRLADIDDVTYYFDHRLDLDFGSEYSLITKLYGSREDATSALNDPDFQNYYTVCKAEYGDSIGYRITDLVYAGDLIGTLGAAVTTVLDNIKNMLGDYEYFYNLEGQFVWQRKPDYVNVSWNNLVSNDGDIVHGESAAYTSSITYSFENHNLINSFANNPNLLNIKNDFSIFGQKTLMSGTQIPIHLRYAVENKPIMYRAYDGTVYATEEVDEEDLRVVSVVPRSEEEILELMNKAFQREPNPEGLNNDWWDVKEWGEYYKYLTGEYPNQGMNEYKTATTKIDLQQYFVTPAPHIPGFYSGSWNKNNDCFLFDTLKVDGVIYLGYTGHNPWCGHLYHDYFMQYYDYWEEKGYEFHAYFYKPRIPTAVIDDILREEFSIKIRETPIIVDWREIIYQMAYDYMHHGTTDVNNYELVNSASLTADDLKKGIYYVKKDEYIRATEFDKYQTYYYKDGNVYKIATEVNINTNFNSNVYYYKNEKSKYNLVTSGTPDTNTNYYVYVDFYHRLRSYNDKYFPTGVTGYEQYYTDMMSFWRDIYDPNYIGTYNIANINKGQYYTNGVNYYWFKSQAGYSFDNTATYYSQDLYGKWNAHKALTASEFYANAQFYFLPIQGRNYPVKANGNYDDSNLTDDYIFKSDRKYYTFANDEYYLEYSSEYTNKKIFDLEYQLMRLEQQYQTQYNTIVNDNSMSNVQKEIKLNSLNKTYIAQQNKITTQLDSIRENPNNYRNPYAYWNKKVFTNPEDLVFWIEFLDTDGDLSQYSVQRIGDRPKTENNTDIKSVYNRQIPNVIFVDNSNDLAELKKTHPGYTFILVSNSIDYLFKISSQGQSCWDKMNSLLYQYTVAAETITVNAIPIYYLQPNTRIFITDENSGINGEYLITRINYQLSYNGMMSISATKAIDRIY